VSDHQQDPPPPSTGRSSLPTAIDAGVLDAELAGLLWALIEARMPVIVAGPTRPEREALLDALVGLLPPTTEVLRVDPTGDVLAGLPDTADERHVVLRPLDLVGAADSPSGLDPVATRACVRAVAVGHGLAASIEADSLEAVLERLGGPPVRAGADELSWLGLVVVLGVPDPADADPGDQGRGAVRERVVAAHWLRPVARDAHGHLQRLGPAVLATWDAAAGRWAHFAWGVLPELAMRIGRRPGDLDLDVAARSDLLGELHRSRVPEAVALAALAGYRRSSRED
jgi:hypothetical protein